MKPARPAAVPATGFCIHLRRIRQQKRARVTHARTIGEYQCWWNGTLLPGLAGQMVERNGPGDNSASGVKNHRRICEGTYRLRIHAGERYMTYGYAGEGFPMPGLLLDESDTSVRSAILIHPCHHDHGYLSSIGCLNPASGLTTAASKIKLPDSRARVIALIEAMKSKLGSAFPRKGLIPGAVIVIEGEPQAGAKRSAATPFSS